jgi:hypothetical protein
MWKALPLASFLLGAAGDLIYEAGDHKFTDDGGKGVATHIRTNTETLTFANDATKVTSSLVPADVTVLGITTRVTTAGAGCTSVDIGDGADQDMFANDHGITSGTTSDPADSTATGKMGYQSSAWNVTITANGGNCTSGVWSVTAHYLDVSAATFN